MDEPKDEAKDDEAAEATVREHQLVCFCGDPTAAQQFAPVVVAAGGTVIDCTDAHASAADSTLIDAEGSPGATGLLVTPQAGTLLLALLANAVGEHIRKAVATVLLPASELSDTGTEELAGQAAAMLNFGDAPLENFGRRLAFDTWLDTTPPAGAAEAIRKQLATLGVPAPALTALRVSVFHAVGASVHFPATPADELRDALQGAGVPIDATNSDGQLIDSPSRVAGSSELHVCGVRSEGAGSWLWSLLDNHHAAAANALGAIRLRLPMPAASG